MTVRTRTSPTGKQTGSGGFTLMELMVVLAILGLALILAVPVLDRLLPGLELRTDARSFASALREARATAIGRNEVVRITIDRKQGALKVGGAVIVRSSSEISIMDLAEPSESPAAAADEIRFFPDGTSTGVRLTLAHDDRRKHVVVDWLTGAVSVSD